MNSYTHIRPEDCGKKVELYNPDYNYKRDVEVQMVITTPKGRIAIFKGCDDEDASQAIREFMEAYHVR